ncbi:MAG: leucine-rich repeat protein, partial [Clostridia bacterium]|nr:leucine-rich repeat protein [Clostridia bacterium]
MKRMISFLLVALMLFPQSAVGISASYTDSNDDEFVFEEENAANAVSVDTIKVHTMVKSGESAEESPYSYTVQDGGAYITGTKDYNYFTDNNISDVVIPSEIDGYPVVGVNRIGSWWEGVVKSVTIPESVKYISDGAFDSFYRIEKICIESTQVSLSYETFGNLEYITEFVINKNHPDYVSIDGVLFDKDVTTIVAYPYKKGDTYHLPVTISDISFIKKYPYVNFVSHPDSTELVVENGVTYNKNKTQIISCDKTISGNYVMPSTVEYIAGRAFQKCIKLTGVVISPLVTEIAYATFDNCPNLTSVVLPTELKSIDLYAFSDCKVLRSVEIPSKLETIEEKAFCNSGLESLDLPGSVSYIGEYCFMNAQLKTVVTQNSTQKNGLSISVGAFKDNAQLKTVSLGEGLEFISAIVFENCSSLTEVNLPDSLTEIGWH